jgi:hypothetical protein
MSLLSQSVVHETISQNGRVIKNMDADTVSSGDSGHSNFITKGSMNGVPFLITNIRGILKKPNLKRKTSKKHKSIRFRSSTPHPKKNAKKTKSFKK